jgi:5'-deoxynucleotidase YfbR-like HD superfamily hydrolase
MPKPSFADIQRIYEELVIPFYKIKRDMYIPAEDGRQENDAEHSWSLALMVFMLAPRIDPAVDMPKAVLYAITHDLIEIHSGDTSVWAPQQDHDSKQERESAALAKMAANFKDFDSLQEYLANYQAKADKEACFVYALDKFHNWMTVLMGKDAYYSKYNKIPMEKARQKMLSQRQKAAVHPVVARYFDQIIKAFDEHPEYFYTGK